MLEPGIPQDAGHRPGEVHGSGPLSGSASICSSPHRRPELRRGGLEERRLGGDADGFRHGADSSFEIDADLLIDADLDIFDIVSVLNPVISDMTV